MALKCSFSYLISAEPATSDLGGNGGPPGGDGGPPGGGGGGGGPPPGRKRRQAEVTCANSESEI